VVLRGAFAEGRADLLELAASVVVEPDIRLERRVSNED